MSIETPLGTPTKCGCAGGIVVSCSTTKVQRNNQKRNRVKKSIQPPTPVECSVCAQEKAQNDRCRTDNDGSSRDEIDETRKAEEILIERCEGEDTAIYTGKPWYTSMFGGALGRWAASAKRRNQSPKNRDGNRRPLSTPNVYQINNICTNNNCKATDRCKPDQEVSVEKSSTKTPPSLNKTKIATKNKSESDLDVHKIDANVWYKQSECVNISKPDGQGCVESGIRPDEIKDNCTSNKLPTARWRRLRSTRGRSVTESRSKTDGECSRKKLPNLPYRETGNEDKKPVMDIAINNKRQRGKRKYFSSPIHRKEPTREPSTYVSFQDDIANDVYINVDVQPDFVSGSASPDSMYSNLYNTNTAMPNQISPSSMNDDVFASDSSEEQQRQSSVNECDTNSCASKEELDDARIAKLFHQVNSAFDINGHEGKASRQENWECTDTDNTHGYARHPSAQEFGFPKKSNNEPIETIMASANLHASLDNALSMLTESTKLLSPNDTQGWHHALYNMRHQPSILNMGSIHNCRSRTYSTCSRLETIEEENDRVEDISLDDVHKNTRDATSCTFSDSSEYEKVYLSSSGTTSLTSASAVPQRESQSATSSFHHQRLSDREVSELAIKCIMNAGSGHRQRQYSTSTISIGSLRRKGSSKDNAFPHTPSTTDKCAACEWNRNSQTIATSSIPNDAWKWIAGEHSQCHNHGHIHPWGVCGERNNLPVLCHSHYLQYYQYLQNDSKVNRLRRRQLHSISSQADSLIDYDIKEVMNSMDEFAATSSDSSATSFHRSSYQKEQLFVRDGNVLVSAQSNIRSQYLDVKKHDSHIRSNTDLSINSDSAFSTNGSLTPSTRDGANTDGESIESIHDHPGFCNDLMVPCTRCTRTKIEKNNMNGNASQGQWEQSVDIVDGDASNSVNLTIIHETSRGKRTQSYDDTGFIKVLTKDSNICHDKRYSVVSSLGSYPSPLTSDPLGDSAVHLPDSSSSHSTHLSSDSFYSSGTSHGDKETCLLDGVLCEDILSRSSSETSLKSEGTLCLSEFGISQQNISLFSAPSFPQINELISPKRNKTNFIKESKKFTTNLSHPEKFDKWIEKAEMTENALEAFLNLSLSQAETSTFEASDPTNGSQLGTVNYPTIYNNDTLTSSSGSSDTNTLGSGSSGSTYASSSLRSYRSSRFNTLDSSSCVSTDDTGETVIDQYMLRPNTNLCDIQESITHRQKLKKKRSHDVHRKRYQPSTFHYQNLELPLYKQSQDDLNHERESLFESCDDISIKEVARNTQILVTRSRASSMSCVLTSVTETSCVVRQCKSLPSLHFSQTTDKKTVQIIKYNRNIGIQAKTNMPSPNLMSPIYSPVLQTKVQSMIQNCANIDNVILSLRESLNITQDQPMNENLDQKLVELGNILKQKDEVINQLHRMLLECSTKDNKKVSHQNNATL